MNATREVASLAKVGPLNRQSAGVMELLRSPSTLVHLVTLLEEMPVQETLDAADELARDGYPLGAVIVNRARPDLGTDDGQVDVALLREGLSRVDVSAEHAAALAVEIDHYAQRQLTQRENSARLEHLALPQIELPDLTPPVELGELSELAARFTEALAL